MEHGSAADTKAGVRSMAKAQEDLIRRTVSACNGNLTLAARQLHIAKSTLYVKMQRYVVSRLTIRR